MKKVAVFGNAGGGKSTLAKELAGITGLPLFSIDVLQYRDGQYQPGSAIPQAEYLALHAALLDRDAWIIDGFDSAVLTWERFAAADTLIHIDLPIATHFWWITKRLIKGVFATPPGWPANSPLLASTFNSYRVLWICHRRLTPRYRQHAAAAASSQRVYHLRSRAGIKAFLDAMKLECRALDRAGN